MRKPILHRTGAATVVAFVGVGRGGLTRRSAPGVGRDTGCSSTLSGIRDDRRRSLDAHELGPWVPLSVGAVHDLFRRATFRWYVAGGRALELAIGESWREHDDIDVGVCRHELAAVHRYLSDWDLHVAAAGRLDRWDGRQLSGQRHENNIWVRRTADMPWALDITVGGGDGEVWWSRRDPSVRLPWEEAVDHDALGVPHLAPHVQLLMKATSVRPKDDHDAEKVIPELPEQRRTWLAQHLPPDHSWQRHCHPSRAAG